MTNQKVIVLGDFVRPAISAGMRLALAKHHVDVVMAMPGDPHISKADADLMPGILALYAGEPSDVIAMRENTGIQDNAWFRQFEKRKGRKNRNY